MKSTVVAHCPECGGGWEFTEFTQVAQDTYLSYNGTAVCPRCGAQFSWVKPGELQSEGGDGEDYTTFGGRRPKTKKKCACGCGIIFFTSHADKHYLNDAHAMRGYRKGIVVEPKKRNVGTRAPTRKEKR
jgi:hypothetical protein